MRPRDRSNRFLEADRSDHVCFRGRNNRNQFWNQSDQIRNSVRFGPQKNYGDVEFRQMLLERQISIDRNEYIKFCRRSAQQLTVCYSHPTLIRNGANFKRTERGR
jgi:hypothetical protein